MALEALDLRKAFRFDKPNGFLIIHNGVPFQAKFDSEYWLATVDGPMHGDMAHYIYSAFAEEIRAEFMRTHPLIEELPQ